MTIRTRLAALFGTFALVSGFTVLTMAAPANAAVANITVTSAADTSGTCPSASNCTLRQALSDASSGGVNGGDDINITISVGISTIALQLAPLGYDGGNGGAHTLTINGNGATVNGNGTFALFQSQSTGAVALSGLNFFGGSSTTDGGAVSAAAALSLHDATISNNYSAVRGGAVFGGATVELSNVFFDNNIAAVRGGAVYSSLDANINFATFTDNSAAMAGAISARNTLTVSDSSFTRNAATFDGGAVMVVGQILASRSYFEDNSAQSNGGAVVATTGTFSQTEFTINTVFSGSGLGGAVHLNGNTGLSTVEESVFNVNSAPGGGGAIFSQSALAVSQSTFYGNSAYNGTGGGIHAYEDVTISHSNFFSNLADVAGAAAGLALSIADSTFQSNVAQVDVGAVYGGAITISGSSFDENEAALNSAAIESAGALTISSTNITNNSAGGSGAAQANGAISITNSTIVGNSSYRLVLGGNSLDVSYSTIADNSSTDAISSPALVGTTGISLFGNVLSTSDFYLFLCNRPATSLGYNFANDTTCGLSNTGDSEDVSNDPMLGALGADGSETLT